MNDLKSIYEIKINDIWGDAIELNDFKGKYILFVNVASECGFTGQYKDLQKLHEEYGSKLVVIGVPCNQFGGQEPGESHEITAFCTEKYSVTFLMTEKKLCPRIPLYTGTLLFFGHICATFDNFFNSYLFITKTIF